MPPTPEPGPWLLLDAATPRLHIGLLHCQPTHWKSLHRTLTPPLEALHPLIGQTLQDAHLGLEDLRGFFLNAGSGSILGIRTAAMTLRTWRALPALQHLPVLAYHTLDIAAALARRQQPSPPWHLLTESRQQQWLVHSVLPDQTTRSEIPHATLATLAGTLFYLPQRKGWLPPPSHSVPLEYDLTNLPHYLSEFPLVPMSEPDALLSSSPEYRLWNQDRHRPLSPP